MQLQGSLNRIRIEANISESIQLTATLRVREPVVGQQVRWLVVNESGGKVGSGRSAVDPDRSEAQFVASVSHRSYRVFAIVEPFNGSSGGVAVFRFDTSGQDQLEQSLHPGVTVRGRAPQEAATFVIASIDGTDVVSSRIDRGQFQLGGLPIGQETQFRVANESGETLASCNASIQASLVIDAQHWQ